MDCDLCALANRMRFRDPGALAKIRALGAEEIVLITKKLICLATGDEDVSLSISVLQEALNRGVRDELESWISKEWNALHAFGRLFYLNAAIDGSLVITTAFLRDLFSREATSDHERLRIMTGILATWDLRNAARDVTEMLNELSSSRDAAIRKRCREMSKRIMREVAERWYP